jgi:hypothetical protein
MKPAIVGFSGRCEAVFGYQRVACGVRFGARCITGTLPICSGSKLGTDDEPVGRSGSDPEPDQVPTCGDGRMAPLAAATRDRRRRGKSQPAIGFSGEEGPPGIALRARVSPGTSHTGSRRFLELLGTHCYGLPILLPSDFLERERAAGRLRQT